MTKVSAIATLSLVGLIGMPALGQSRQERVERVAAMLAGATDDNNEVYTDARTGEVVRATPAQIMRSTLTSVDLDAIPGRLALEIWSSQTGVPLVVNWAALEAQGIDTATPVSLKLNRVPAEQVLKLIVQQIHPDPIGDDQLLIDIEPWYVKVITRQDALRKSVTKMYFIGDLLMDIPNFDNAPGFDLNEALSNTNTGGSNGGGGGGGGENDFFNDDDDDNNREPSLSKEEKAERIADVIRDTIEPDIWRENGGDYASVRYFRGMLVVKAPEFVHEQIGVPVGGGSTRTASSKASTYRSSDNSQKSSNTTRPRRSTSGNVSGTAPSGPRLVR